MRRKKVMKVLEAIRLLEEAGLEVVPGRGSRRVVWSGQGRRLGSLPCHGTGQEVPARFLWRLLRAARPAA